jgi:hypothetical protein
MKNILELKRYWLEQGVRFSKTALIKGIYSFQETNKCLLPKDLVEYFMKINGTNQTHDNNYFDFYSLDNFKSVKSLYHDYTRIPNYSQLINTLPNSENYYVFADFQMCLFSYAIYLDKNLGSHSVVVLCGGEYRIIADSFSDFIDLFLVDSDKLYF